MSGTEERLLDAEAVADEMAAYIEAQIDPDANRWNDPRAICDMMRALIKSIRLGLIADPDSVIDLEEELESTLKSARAWMCVGPAPEAAPTARPAARPAAHPAASKAASTAATTTATSVTRQMPAVGGLLTLEEDDLDLPANLDLPRKVDLGSPLSQRTTARPPPGQSPRETWDKAPHSDPKPAKKKP
jgi:hypothetical protein